MATLAATTDPRVVALRDANLAGAPLAGGELELLSLELANLAGADLRGASFRHVDFTNASFRGARLDGAQFRMCRGIGVDFTGASCEGVRWNHCELGAATFRGANLRSAVWSNCSLAAALLDEADLAGALLSSSDCRRASFRGASLVELESVGTLYAEADLTDALDFAYCRELVVEVLLRDIGAADLEALQVVGAVTLMRQHCYPTWAALVRDRPRLLELAASTFARYPRSGCREAFALGLRRAAEAG